jgi:hypothetical protein
MARRATAPHYSRAMRFPRFARNVLGFFVPLGCLAACGGNLAPAGDLEGAICGDDAGDAPLPRDAAYLSGGSGVTVLVRGGAALVQPERDPLEGL